jgi:hypothetical protein
MTSRKRKQPGNFIDDFAKVTPDGDQRDNYWIADFARGTPADNLRNITFNLLNSGNHDDFANNEDDIYWDEFAAPRNIVDPELLQQQFLEQLLHDNELVPVEFSMNVDWFTEFLTRESENVAILPRDYDAIFDKHSHLKTTKRAFAIDLQNVMAQYGIKFSQINEIFAVLQRHTTSLNLPILKPNPLLGKRNPPTRNNMAAYCGKDNRTVVIDVCEADCVAFHGMQYNPKTLQIEDFSKLLQCPVCEGLRYSCCSNTKCKDKGYFDCSPFHFNSDDNKLGHQDRTPLKTMYYRPITSKLLSLYKTSLKPGNEALLLYFLSKNRVTREGCIIDINDGTEVQNQMEAMSALFKSFKERYNLTSNERVYQCSLLVTLFYDGITLFDRNADSLWPLMCSIASCNPSHRSKLGVGLFLAALHNIKSGSGAEKYFIKHILTEELQTLEKGILFKFQHPVSSLPIQVFLQARCIFAHLDLPALEHFVKVQAHGSLYGCTLCGAFHGQWSKCLGKMIYNGERGRLHSSHWLRTFGQNINHDM